MAHTQSLFEKNSFGSGEDVDFSDSTALIVEPAPLNRSILVSQFREFGFPSVSSCARLAEALARYTANEMFDVRGWRRTRCSAQPLPA